MTQDSKQQQRRRTVVGRTPAGLPRTYRMARPVSGSRRITGTIRRLFS